ncbi:MAG: SDR family NAD(P)-dependent oxidoreductase [Planktomarina sp.]
MRYVLITGAARGLGRAMLDHYVALGDHVVAVDLDPSPLIGINNITTIACDLSNPSLARAIKLNEQLDVVIHAAGISAAGSFTELPWNQQQAVMDVNFAGTVNLTQSLLSAGCLAPNAKMCFVSSLSHYVSYPGAAVYAGSKDGLTSYARSLGKAYKRKLSVTVAFPGPLRTEHAAKYAPDNSKRAVARRMPPEKAAKTIIYDMDKRRATSLPGWGAKFAADGGTIAPKLMGKLMRKAIFEKL